MASRAILLVGGAAGSGLLGRKGSGGTLLTKQLENSVESGKQGYEDKSFLHKTLLMLKPAPQCAVRGFFRIDLDVNSALFQMLQLFRIQVGRSADGAVHSFANREVGKGGSA